MWSSMASERLVCSLAHPSSGKRKPQDHAEAKILSDHEVPGGALDERMHLADLARQGLLVEQAIGHIPVKGIERAETISGIRPAQIHSGNIGLRGPAPRRCGCRAAAR